MKIAIVMEDYFKGGQNVFVAMLINGWPADDRFVIVSNRDNPGLELIRSRLRREVEFVTHRHNYARRLKESLPRPLQPARRALMALGRYALLPAQAVLMSRLLGRIAPDAVIISNGGYPGGPLCRAAALAGLGLPPERRPLLIAHNLPVPRPRYAWPLELAMDRLICQGCGAIVGVSRHTEQTLRARLGAAARGKTTFIHNGVEAVEPPPDAPSLRAELGLEPADPLVLTIANLEPRKGHAFLLEAMARVHERLPRAALLLAGSGGEDMRRGLEERARGLGLGGRVFFLGHRDDIPRLAGQADLLAVPSQAYESFGLVCLEAMMQGKAVVATDTGGLPEVVADGLTGRVVARRDAEAFARAILELLEDEPLRRRLGAAGRERFREKFGNRRMALEYRRLLARRGGEAGA